MCNLYSMTRAPEGVLRLFRVGHNRAPPIEGKSAIFPGYVAPVVRKADDGERELVNLNWGFVLLRQGRAPRRVTNVRDDKILTTFSSAEGCGMFPCNVQATEPGQVKSAQPPSPPPFAKLGSAPFGASDRVGSTRRALMLFGPLKYPVIASMQRGFNPAPPVSRCAFSVLRRRGSHVAWMCFAMPSSASCFG
jgi:hypothetical protein